MQILIGVVVGGLIGWLRPDWGNAVYFLRDIFLNLIKSIIAPLVFSTLVVGIAGGGDLKKVGRMGVNVNAVAPGFVDTEMTRTLQGEHREQIVRRSALRRLVDVEDVANAVEFLLSDGARNISGTALTIDAGATA